MIQEAYVSFETAKLLKEKGFNEKTDTIYWDSPLLKEVNISPRVESSDGMAGSWINHDDEYPRPTHQMVLAYLREKDIYIDVFPHKIYERKKQFLYEIKDEHAFYQSEGFFKTFEDATEAAIKYTFENLI